MRTLCAQITAAFLLAANPSLAQSPKPIRLLNHCRNEIVDLQFSSTSRTAWGPNWLLRDDDGKLQPEESLDVPGVAPGRYDVKIADSLGRACVFKNVNLQAGGRLVIEEADMAACQKRR